VQCTSPPAYKRTGGATRSENEEGNSEEYHEVITANERKGSQNSSDAAKGSRPHRDTIRASCEKKREKKHVHAGSHIISGRQRPEEAAGNPAPAKLETWERGY
jgi:hypothetical protein